MAVGADPYGKDVVKEVGVWTRAERLGSATSVGATWAELSRERLFLGGLFVPRRGRGGLDARVLFLGGVVFGGSHDFLLVNSFFCKVVDCNAEMIVVGEY